jgi:RNA polymerase sigma-70 factor (ECF subfamily)
MPTDTQLMAAICARDAEAFEILAQRHREMLRHCLLQIVRDPNTADDLLQETLLRVWMRAEQWDERGAVRAWLVRIATNLALNSLRTCSRRREQPLEPPRRDVFEEEEPLTPAWLIDPAENRPEELAAQAERRARLQSLIGDLPEEKRDVLRLVVEADMELREVAETLDIPEGTVKSRLHHARKRLARQWHDFEA